MNEVILFSIKVIVCIGFGTLLMAFFSKNASEKFHITKSNAKIWLPFFFLAVIAIIWYDTPSRLGDYVYIERDLTKHSNTIHTSSSCPKIDKAYSVNETRYYTYTPYVDRFCKRCFYESDVIKLTTGENKSNNNFSHTKELGL